MVGVSFKREEKERALWRVLLSLTMEETSLEGDYGQEIWQISSHKKRDAVHQSKNQEAQATGKMRVWKRG